MSSLRSQEPGKIDHKTAIGRWWMVVAGMKDTVSHGDMIVGGLASSDPAATGVDGTGAERTICLVC